MTSRYGLIGLVVLTAFAAAPPCAHAASDSDPYTIMVPEKGSRPSAPEPWLAPKYKSPRGTPQHVVTPTPPRVPRPRAVVPPSINVPETGRTLQNLPAPVGAGPGGAETLQDRALRCAHQAGVYGQAAGNRNAYIGGCINQ